MITRVRQPYYIHITNKVLNKQNNTRQLIYIKKCSLKQHFPSSLFLCYKTYSYICIGKKKKLSA